ncbi:MAG: carbonate dehydratase [Deltaproteobacteria bacterium]
MKKLPGLFANNRVWASSIEKSRPDFFKTLSKQQSPDYLWIGCSDSRVPANEIVGLMSGELFVHRNVANIVVHSDMNCLSVIQYAVEVLKVKHIIVCGHYGCGGVIASVEEKMHGLIDNWLTHIKDIRSYHQDELGKYKDRTALINRLCELNVVRQAFNVCQTTIVQAAWARKQELTVHGWIYGIEDGFLRDLNVCAAGKKDYLRMVEALR